MFMNVRKLGSNCNKPAMTMGNLLSYWAKKAMTTRDLGPNSTK
jgi:hypothetical protein